MGYFHLDVPNNLAKIKTTGRRSRNDELKIINRLSTAGKKWERIPGM